MKLVQIIPICDGHHAEQTEADVEREISIDHSKAVKLDLCKDCNVLVTQLQELMKKGEPVPTPNRGPKTAEVPPCPFCGHPSPSRSALGQHLKYKHSSGIKAAGLAVYQ